MNVRWCCTRPGPAQATDGLCLLLCVQALQHQGAMSHTFFRTCSDQTLMALQLLLSTRETLIALHRHDMKVGEQAGMDSKATFKVLNSARRSTTSLLEQYVSCLTSPG